MEPQDVVNARLARYAETQDARDLWPEVTVSAFRAAQTEIARVTAAVLADAPGRVTLQLPPDVDARALGVAASAAGVGPLLGRWCETGRLDAPQPFADGLATHLDHGRRRAARMRQELDHLLIALADRDVEVLVLKGTHTGQRYFPEPGTRPTTDIDLLIRPVDLRAAHQALRALEFAEDAATAEPQRSHWTPRNVGPVRSLERVQRPGPPHRDRPICVPRASSGRAVDAGDRRSARPRGDCGRSPAAASPLGPPRDARVGAAPAPVPVRRGVHLVGVSERRPRVPRLFGVAAEGRRAPVAAPGPQYPVAPSPQASVPDTEDHD